MKMSTCVLVSQQHRENDTVDVCVREANNTLPGSVAYGEATEWLQGFYQPYSNLTKFPERITQLGQCVFVCAPVWDLPLQRHCHMSETG